MPITLMSNSDQPFHLPFTNTIYSTIHCKIKTNVDVCTNVHMYIRHYVLIVKLSTLTLAAQSLAVSWTCHHSSAAHGDLVELRLRTTRYGKRSFPASAPLTWNLLPTNVRDVSIFYFAELTELTYSACVTVIC